MEKEELERYNNWDVVHKLKNIIERYGKARVYFCATSCGLNNRASTRNKMKKWIRKNIQHNTRLIDVPDKRGRGWTEEGILAIRIDITTITDFIKTWVDLNTLRAKCGDSIFISDGQEVEVKVIQPNSILAIEFE